MKYEQIFVCPKNKYDSQFMVEFDDIDIYFDADRDYLITDIVLFFKTFELGFFEMKLKTASNDFYRIEKFLKENCSWNEVGNYYDI